MQCGSDQPQAALTVLGVGPVLIGRCGLHPHLGVGERRIEFGALKRIQSSHRVIRDLSHVLIGGHRYAGFGSISGERLCSRCVLGNGACGIPTNKFVAGLGERQLS